jgi:hypothetical protein
MRRILAVPVALALSTACGSKKPSATKDDDQGPVGTLVGIDPERWGCEVVATVAAVGEVLGGPVRAGDSLLTPERGLARPCSYTLEAATGPETWFWDLDCRSGALRTADTMWTQSLQNNAALVAAASDATEAERKDDAGVVHAPPPLATEVAVGKKGLDQGQAVLFVDDDAPCYGRVSGPDAARRLALAQLIVKNLRPATAPMEPRPAGK